MAIVLFKLKYISSALEVKVELEQDVKCIHGKTYIFKKKSYEMLNKCSYKYICCITHMLYGHLTFLILDRRTNV